jgi:hypothetical protein
VAHGLGDVLETCIFSTIRAAGLEPWLVFLSFVGLTIAKRRYGVFFFYGMEIAGFYRLIPCFEQN